MHQLPRVCQLYFEHLGLPSIRLLSLPSRSLHHECALSVLASDINISLAIPVANSEIATQKQTHLLKSLSTGQHLVLLCLVTGFSTSQLYCNSSSNWHFPRSPLKPFRLLPFSFPSTRSSSSRACHDSTGGVMTSPFSRLP